MQISCTNSLKVQGYLGDFGVVSSPPTALEKCLMEETKLALYNDSSVTEI